MSLLSTLSVVVSSLEYSSIPAHPLLLSPARLIVKDQARRRFYWKTRRKNRGTKCSRKPVDCDSTASRKQKLSARSSKLEALFESTETDSFGRIQVSFSQHFPFFMLFQRLSNNVQYLRRVASVLQMWVARARDRGSAAE